MKRVATIIAVAALAAVSILPVAAETGNGAPNGAHYNLNIIGVPHDKTADMTGDNGHRIFVDLKGPTKIMLSPSDPGVFQVTDANGTDGSAAFSLPVPAECLPDAASCTVRYTVWVRALGKPNGAANMYTCVVDPDAPDGYLCSDPEWWVELTRTANKSTFTNYSKELLFLSTDIDGDGTVEHVSLFDDLFGQYYWQYDNQGLKLAQMRFYMGDSTINW